MRPILFVIPGWDFKVHSYGVMILWPASPRWRSASGGHDASESTPTSSTSWRRGFSWAVSLERGEFTCFRTSNRSTVWATSSGAGREATTSTAASWAGLTGSILYWFRRPFPFWLMTDVAAPAVAIGNRHRPDRLLLERLLLRGSVRPAVGRLLPGRVARLGSPG